MNYYELSKQFWNLCQDKTFGHLDTAMYFYLLNECNIRRWLNPFELQTRNITIMLSVSRKTISVVRNRLKERGVIDFIEGKGRGASIYKIVGLNISNESLDKEFCVSGCASSTKHEESDCVSSTKHEESDCVSSMKHDKNVVLPSSFPEETQKVTQNKNTPLYIEDNIRHKDSTTSRDVVVPHQPIAESLFAEEEKKASRCKPKRVKESYPPPPSFDEVRQYFLLQNADKRLEDWEYSCRSFFDYFAAVDWIDKNNRRITRWDSRANSWIRDDEKRQKEKKLNETQQTDRFSERRGTEPGAKSRKGFKGTF